jgi:hypothetical protein
MLCCEIRGKIHEMSRENRKNKLEFDKNIEGKNQKQE